MKDSSKILLAVGFGALAGGIAGYYLNSDDGRKSRKRAVKEIKRRADEANVRMHELAEEAKSAITDVADKAQTYLNKASDRTHDMLAHAKESFEAGVKKAQHKEEVVTPNNVKAKA
ncbi:MAG: YtxH domain-containing protein [Saprospiraceae bacterium]|nr:YtxH domain-containing protein [Saprospiraceae bacterium]MCB9319392.1 YtxH domain-containing protein [Lewinellaceae bacterium]